MSDVVAGPLSYRQLLTLILTCFRGKRLDILRHYLTTGILHSDTAALMVASKNAFALSEPSQGQQEAIAIADEIITMTEPANAS